MEPRYAHDCSACLFLGQHEEYDLYYCTGYEKTPVARRSDAPSDYISGSCWWPDYEAIRVALKLAAHKGLLKREDRYLEAVMNLHPDARAALEKYLR